MDSSALLKPAALLNKKHRWLTSYNNKDNHLNPNPSKHVLHSKSYSWPTKDFKGNKKQGYHLFYTITAFKSVSRKEEDVLKEF